MYFFVFSFLNLPILLSLWNIPSIAFPHLSAFRARTRTLSLSIRFSSSFHSPSISLVANESLRALHVALTTASRTNSLR